MSQIKPRELAEEPLQDVDEEASTRTFLFTAILVLFALFVCAGCYLGSIVWRCSALYDIHNRWTAPAYRLDKDYGYFPKPFQLVHHSLKYGERVPVIFDDNGFRIPFRTETQPASSPELRLLFLGDSFTHGYGVPAENTFAYLTAETLGGLAMNAGGSGWGLSQMVIRAQDVIPRLKPDVVVVQYSNWLPDRSLRFYGPTNFAKSPVPYFYESEGMIHIHQPPFQSANFRFPIRRFVGKDLLTFAWNVGIPLFIYDDYFALRTSVRHQVGLLPSPMKSRQKAVEYSYDTIQELCDDNKAEMFILVIPSNIDDVPRDELDKTSWRVVDTSQQLTERLAPATASTWSSQYKFWRGHPPELVDNHPNARMHSVIAEKLVEAIVQTSQTNDPVAEQEAPPDHVSATLRSGR